MRVLCNMHSTLMYTIMFLNVIESVCYTYVYNHVPLMLHKVSQTCIIHHCYIHVIYDMSQSKCLKCLYRPCTYYYVTCCIHHVHVTCCGFFVVDLILSLVPGGGVWGRDYVDLCPSLVCAIWNTTGHTSPFAYLET